MGELSYVSTVIGPGVPQLRVEDVPVRRCCNELHWGPVCPDGRVMCCICYGRYTPDELHVDITGVTWDVCGGCGEQVGE